MFDIDRLPKYSLIFIMTLTECMVLPSEAIECFTCNELPLEIHDSCQTNSTLGKFGNRNNVIFWTWLSYYLKQHTFNYFLFPIYLISSSICLVIFFILFPCLNWFYLCIINHLLGMYNISIRFGKSSLSIQCWRCVHDIQSVLEGTKLL